MSQNRTLLTGPAGSGKTRRVLAGFVAALARHGPEGTALLVPTAAQARGAVRAILEGEVGTGSPAGILGRPVGTFDDLALRILGDDARTPLPAETRLAYLDEALAAAPWNGDASLSARPGFRALLGRALVSLKENAQEPEAVAATLDAHGGATAREFGRVLRDYEAVRARRGGEDRTDLLRRAIRTARDDPGRLAALRWFAVDGFHNFTPLQFELLTLLLAGDAEATVTLPLDEGRRDLFAEALRTLGFLERWTWRRERLAGNHRARHPALAAVEAAFLAEEGAGRTAPIAAPAVVEIEAAPSPRREAEAVARRIALLARDAGVRWREIGVVVRGDDPRLGHLIRALDGYGVPHRASDGARLSEAPVARAHAAVVRLLLDRWDRTDLALVASSPYFDLREGLLSSAPPLPRQPMEPEAWVAWAERAEAPDGFRKALGRLAALRAEVHGSPEGLRAAVESIRVPTDLSGVEPHGDLSALGRELGAERRWWALWENVIEGGARVKSVGAARGRWRLFEEAAAETAVPGADRREDVVRVLDPWDARGAEFRVAFVVGLNEGSYPRHRGRSPFFSSDLVRALEGEGIFLPDPGRLAAEESFVAYVALTRARERLVLSYARSDASGAVSGPSPFLLEVAEALGLDGGDPAPSGADSFDFVTPGEARERAAANDPPGRALAEALGDDPALARARAIGVEAAAVEPVEIDDPRYRAAVEGRLDGVGLSPTRLRTFQDCAYKHFARYALGLDPRRDEPPSLEDRGVQGNVAHRVLAAWTAGTSETTAALVAGAVRLELGDRRLTADEEEIAERIATDLDRFAAEHRAWIEPGPWAPVGQEIDLGDLGGGGGPARLEADGEAAFVAGCLDRVDLRTLPDGTRGVRVLDYKYSSRGADEAPVRKEIESLVDLQLPLYLLVAADRLEAEPVAALRVPVRGGRFGGVVAADASARWGLDPAVEAVLPKGVGYEAYLDDARRKIVDLARRIRAGEMLRRPRLPDGCAESRCAYRYLCRVQPWFERGRGDGESAEDDA